MISLSLASLSEHFDVFASLWSLDTQISAIAAIATALLGNGHKPMLCRNGSSAADSQHHATELAGHFIQVGKPLAATALGTDSSALTRIGNDCWFADVFERQCVFWAKRVTA